MSGKICICNTLMEGLGVERGANGGGLGGGDTFAALDASAGLLAGGAGPGSFSGARAAFLGPCAAALRCAARCCSRTLGPRLNPGCLYQGSGFCGAAAEMPGACGTPLPCTGVEACAQRSKGLTLLNRGSKVRGNVFCPTQVFRSRVALSQNLCDL